MSLHIIIFFDFFRHFVIVATYAYVCSSYKAFDISTDRQYIPSLFALEILRKSFCGRVEVSILLARDACECKHKPPALVYTHRCNKVVGYASFIVPARVISVSSQTETRLAKAPYFIFLYSNGTKDVYTIFFQTKFFKRRRSRD